MINSDVLLFPDTGPDFVRSLKTAVLYSERVYVLTLHPRVLPRLLGTAMEDPTLSQLREKVHGRERLIRSAEYSRFMMAHIKELNLLISEEVLLPVSFGPIGLFHLSDE